MMQVKHHARHALARSANGAVVRRALAFSRAGARARPSTACRASSAASSTSRVEALRHVTEDGWGLELLRQQPPNGPSPSRPPLLFVHGSYHAAWCWAEKFLPYFAEQGYDAWAVSLRAQGNSDCISQDKESPILVAGTLDSHARDLADLISHVFPDTPPVVVAHSFGGLILQKYVLGGGAFPQLAGVAYLASCPPSGNKQMVMRFLTRDLWLSLKVTWGFVAKSFATSVDACRELFFSQDIDRAELERYQKQLAACSPVRLIDLTDVNKQTPLPPPPPGAPPAFVLGGEDDKVVDVEANRELAAALNVPAVILPRLAHDVMLDTRWREAAAELGRWLSALPPAAK